jgi:hypothetical protein
MGWRNGHRSDGSAVSPDEEREAFLDEHQRRIQKIDRTLQELGELVGDDDDDEAAAVENRRAASRR